MEFQCIKANSFSLKSWGICRLRHFADGWPDTGAITKFKTSRGTYVLIAIIKKRLHLPQSLYEILQILSLTMFEKTPLNQLLSNSPGNDVDDNEPQQLLFLCKALAHY